MTAKLLGELLRGERDAIRAEANGRFLPLDEDTADTERLGVLAGSFNPLHDGHRNLRDAAERFDALSVQFELSVSNVDKPPLAEDAVRRRVSQFTEAILLTNAPTFLAKARLLPHVTFVVGFDTAERILEPRYYDGSRGLTRGLDEIRDLGCRFLVAGRTMDGTFRKLNTLVVPDTHSDLFVSLPESEFRQDISSTELRSQD